MSKIVYTLIALMVVVFFNACSTLHAGMTPNQKSFVAEDAYIMYALRAEELKDSKSALHFFDILYKKSGKKEYLYRALSHQIALKEYHKVLQRIKEATQGSLEDLELIRFKAIALYQLKKYKLALKEFAFIYGKTYDEKILDKMSVILFVNLHQQAQAIAKLETHSRIRGCSELICKRLIGLYASAQNLDGILSTYLRMYEKKNDEAIAKKIIEIYGYQKAYQPMIAFLEKYKIEPETLLELYSVTKNYTKAYKLAAKLYKKSGNINYLGQSAVFEYESADKKSDAKVLQNVVQKLETVVSKEQNPLYENYLGYVLIDHEIDVKKGMQHIENVLRVKPDSAYYLDSLAWGYYKLDQCQQAKKIIDRVVTLKGGDDPEVLKHVKMINQCIKGKN